MNIVRGAEYDTAGLQQLIGRLAERYPGLEVTCAGKSVLGRDITAVHIGEGQSGVLLVGGIHGTNRSTALILLRFLENLAAALETGGEIAGKPAVRVMFGTGLTVIPVLNPDGYEIALRGPAGALHLTGRIHLLCGGEYEIWNANARGVDLHHNFPAGWDILRKMERESGVFGPAPRRYGGPSPESEPETVALTELCRTRWYRHALTLMNSKSPAVYWSYGDKTPPKSKKIAQLIAGAAGLPLEEPMGMVSHGGFKEWFMEELRRPAFTIMTGGLGKAADSENIEKLYAQIEEALVMALVL